MKNTKKVYIIFSILIAIFSFSIVDKTFENDTFFTIPIGNYILENGITDQEQFTWHQGLKFTNSRWLFDIIVATIYNISGFAGIYGFVVVMTIIIGLTLFNILLNKKNNILISFIITLATLYFCRTALVARAQIVSYLLFLLEVFFLDKLIETNKKQYGIFLILDSILLANVHSSVWPMYFVLFLPYFAEIVFEKLGFKNKKVEARKFDFKPILIVFIISLFSGFCTPIAPAPYTDTINVLIGNSTSFINELQPITISGNIEVYGFAFLMMLLIAFFDIKITVSDICTLFGLILMALMASRNKMFLFLIGAIVLAKMIQTVTTKENEKEVNEMINKNKNLVMTSLLIILIFVGLYIDKKDQPYIDEKQFPVAATEYIKDNIDVDSMRIFNHFNFGSYLEFQGIPVFIDSRSGIYCKEFNEGVTVLEDWANCAYFGSESYKEIFEKYGITHALIYKIELINNYICYDEDFEKIYEDDNFVLYEKIN